MATSDTRAILAQPEPLDRGLKTGALGMVSSVVIGVASTGPLQPRRLARARHGRGGDRARSAGDHVARLRADALRGGRLLLPEQVGSGLRHDVFLGDPFHRPVAGWLGGYAIVVAGGLILSWLFVKSIITLSNPANTTTGSNWAGLAAPIWIGIGSLVLGVVLILLQWRADATFSRRRTETGDPNTFARPAAAGQTGS